MAKLTKVQQCLQFWRDAKAAETTARVHTEQAYSNLVLALLQESGIEPGDQVLDAEGRKFLVVSGEAIGLLRGELAPKLLLHGYKITRLGRPAFREQVISRPEGGYKRAE